MISGMCAVNGLHYSNWPRRSGEISQPFSGCSGYLTAGGVRRCPSRQTAWVGWMWGWCIHWLTMARGSWEPSPDMETQIAPIAIPHYVNSLWPRDTIWRHRSGSALAQVMACCLTAPSHYLNQCWPEIIGIHPSATENKMRKICRQKQFEIVFMHLSGSSGLTQWGLS